MMMENNIPLFNLNFNNGVKKQLKIYSSVYGY